MVAVGSCPNNREVRHRSGGRRWPTNGFVGAVVGRASQGAPAPVQPKRRGRVAGARADAEDDAPASHGDPAAAVHEPPVGGANLLEGAAEDEDSYLHPNSVTREVRPLLWPRSACAHPEPIVAPRERLQLSLPRGPLRQ